MPITDLNMNYARGGYEQDRDHLQRRCVMAESGSWRTPSGIPRTTQRAEL
jgi:hypothetical protein